MKLRITSVLTVANHHSYETATLIPVTVTVTVRSLNVTPKTMLRSATLKFIDYNVAMTFILIIIIIIKSETSVTIIRLRTSYYFVEAN